MTKYCPNCKIEVESGKFCPECGSKLEELSTELYCPSCGKVYDHGKFCPDCGVKLEERTKAKENSSGVVVFPEESSPQNAAGSTVCANCGFPLESETSIDSTPGASVDTSSEDDEILAKYTTEEGVLRHLNEEEIPMAVEEISAIAEKGNAIAEVLLAELIIEGHSDKSDVDRAYKLFCDAEEKGSKQGSIGRAFAYIIGLSVEKDLDKANQILDKVLDIPQALSLKGQIYEEKGQIDKAVEWYKKAAEKKHWQGLVAMGHVYMNGSGNIVQDPVKAFQCFLEAALLGVSEAKNMLGLCYKNGIGTEPNGEAALNWFMEAAADNYTDGLVNLAGAYQRGQFGLKQDHEKALELLKRAADNGDAESMYRIGEYYRTSSLLAGQAIEWYQKAADEGYGDAMFRLAQKYLTGDGVDKDQSLAEEWFEQALDAGSPLAEAFEKKLAAREREEEMAREKTEAEERARQEEERIEKEQKAQREREEKERESHSYLSWLDESGEKFRSDTPSETYSLFMKELQKDANNGSALSQKLLGDCYLDGYGVLRDSREAVKWYRISAEQGFARAQNSLGTLYQTGDGVKESMKEAMRWYTKAAEQGCVFAYMNLGERYWRGGGVSKDLEEAAKWFGKAIEAGADFAKKQLDAVKKDIAKEKKERKAEQERKKTQPYAEITSINVEHNVFSNGIEGMNFKCSFITHNMKGKKGSACLYFYNNVGKPLKDFNNAYTKTDGDVAAHIDISPNYDDCVFTDVLIFFPYSELHLNDKYSADIQYSFCVFCEGANALTGTKTVLPFIKVLKTIRTKAVTYDKIWYEDSRGEHLVIHTKLTVKHALNEDGRVAVWFYNSKGTALKAASDPSYRTPDGQVTIQLPIKPNYESCVWKDLRMLIPYSALNLAEGYVHDLRFKIGVFFGKEYLPDSEYVDFEVDVKRGLFSGIKYTLIK